MEGISNNIAKIIVLKRTILSAERESVVNENDERRRSYIEVQVCPQCISSNLRRLGALSGDMTGAMAILPPQYACLTCGWVGRMVIVRTIDVTDRGVDQPKKESVF